MGAPRLDMVIDSVDPADQVIGTVERRKVFQLGANFRVVHVFVFNEKGELAVQQIPSGLRHPGMWGSSVAGYLNAGESYDDAARRKLRGELGLAVPTSLVGRTSMADNGSRKFIALYRAISDGPFAPDPEDVAAVEFLSLKTLAAERVSRARAFTPTFLHVLDCYEQGTFAP